MSSISLHQSNVSLGNREFTPMLTNTQTNILKFHGRTFAFHLFFTFKPAMIEELRQWVINFASSKITTAYTQLYDSASRKHNPGHDGGVVYTLSLSYKGCQKLNVKSTVTENITFENGLRGSSFFLKDDSNKWEPGFKDHHIDMMILVADTKTDVAEHKAQQVINELSPFANCVVTQRGNILKMHGTQVGIEHFGYADGVSQPMYLADEINGQPNGRTWDDTTNLDMLLVEEKDGAPNCFGSYLVFRKLEQDVLHFKNAEGDTAPGVAGRILIKEKGNFAYVKDANGTPTKELGGAMIVGRFENSCPVTLHSEAGIDPDDKHVTNDFDYSNDLAGAKCPFFSHIRLVNPRNGNKKQNPQKIRSHRITRRGITYDDNIPKRIPDADVLNVIPAMLDNNQPTGKLGLLFMCYQNDIKTHFEELQGQWANTGIIDPAKESIGQDCLISQSIPDVHSERTLPQKWGDAVVQSGKFNFGGFVKMLGGKYFYTPSLSFLKNI